MVAVPLVTDAKNKAARTFVQGLAIDIAVGVALVLGTYFVDKNSWGAVEWGILSFSVFKSAIQAVAAFVMRRWLDSKVTPHALLPPSPVPAPVDPGGPGDDGGAGYRWRGGAG